MKARQPLKAKTNLKSTKSLSTSSDGLKSQKKPTLSRTPRKHTVGWWKKKADQVFSQATRYRFAEKLNGEWVASCITCPLNTPQRPLKSLQCGHFMSRQYNSTRYSEENTAPQCYGCNVMQQGKQYEFGIQVDLLYGEGSAKRLYKEAKTPHQFTVAELQQVISDAQAQVDFYTTQQ